MKKLIIAAGIAAAMASFGASAELVQNVVFSAPSYASINTTVKADSYLTVTATDAEASLAEINQAGTTLGSFAVAMTGTDANTYSNVVVERIHAHGYPSAGFKIKLKGGTTECTVEAGTHTAAVADLTGATDPAQGTCGFTKDEAADIQVTTVADSAKVIDAGVKTITAQFRAFHS
ncbi:TPA: hypothetical protein ACIBE3_004490 [Salmonella enterica subsp. enterica serovar Reading]